MLEPVPRNALDPLPGARAALRAATHDVHVRMHHHPSLSRLAAGTIEVDEYRHLLARSYGFYVVVGPILGLADHLTSLLVLDLSELGMDAEAVEALPRCAPPPVKCSHAVIGAKYVLLGASLGGKVMARALAGGSRRTSALPVRFLTGVNAGDWVSFADALDEHLPETAARACATRAAVSMFAAYEDWMAG